MVIGAGNIITGNGSADSVGILATDSSWPGKARNFTVTGTTVTGFDKGVWINPQNDMTADVTISYSNIYGNQIDLVNDYGGVVDTSLNWWGTTDPEEVNLSGSVDFTPMLASEVVQGQPDLSNLIVHTLGEQVGDVGRIQEGVNWVSEGGTVNVKAGTYHEQVTVDKSLTIKGPFHDTVGHDTGRDGVTGEAIIEYEPNSLPTDDEDPAIVVITADGVTFKGFTVRNGGAFFLGDDVVGNAGIGILDASNGVIVNNIAYGNAIGIAIVAEDNDLIGNEIRGNYLYDNVHRDEDGKIVAGGRGVKAGRGIMIDRFFGDKLVSNTIIENNHVTGSADGIYLYAAKETVVGTEGNGNVLYDNFHRGIHLMGSKDNKETNATIAYNAIYNNSIVGFTGIFDVADATIYNIPNARNSAGIRIAGAQNNTVEYNNIYNETETGGLQNKGVRIVYRLSDGEDIEPSGNFVNFNKIYGHDEQFADVSLPFQYGVDNREEGEQASYPVDARLNWWGDASGPYHDYTNLNGEGNRVSKHVLFDPWLSHVTIEPAAGSATTGKNQTFTATLYDNHGAVVDTRLLQYGFNVTGTTTKEETKAMTNGAAGITYTSNRAGDDDILAKVLFAGMESTLMGEATMQWVAPAPDPTPDPPPPGPGPGPGPSPGPSGPSGPSGPDLWGNGLPSLPDLPGPPADPDAPPAPDAPPPAVPTVAIVTGAPAGSSFVGEGTADDLAAAKDSLAEAQAALDANRDNMTADEIAVAEMDLAIARAAIMAVELRLEDADADDAAIAAFNEAVETLVANEGLLSEDQIAEATATLEAVRAESTADCVRC